MKNEKIIGIDLGATNIRGAVVNDSVLGKIFSKRINTKGTEQQVLDDVFEITDKLINTSVKAIGIGVPSVVDIKKGIVYDVQHIPSWKEVPLKQLMEERYKIPVFVNNDANCFALGEYYFGEGKDVDNFVGITLGTGLGSGIIINRQLYAGSNCGAGEFGMLDYLNHNYEYYCSGSFFQNVYHLNGEDVHNRAKNGDKEALQLYHELGHHLGEVIKTVMYTYDPPFIILGGSVASGFSFFKETMWQTIKTFGYPKSIETLQIKPSSLQNSAIFGAAALYFGGR
jgi:glucokinase